MKTSELSGAALDWAVARAERLDCYADMTGRTRPTWATFVDFGDEAHIMYTPSDHWGFGGPIIEREQIQLRLHVEVEGYWSANIFVTNEQTIGTTVFEEGPTPLIAAMRCYVASVLGDEVDVPPDLT